MQILAVGKVKGQVNLEIGIGETEEEAMASFPPQVEDVSFYQGNVEEVEEGDYTLFLVDGEEKAYRRER